MGVGELEAVVVGGAHRGEGVADFFGAFGGGDELDFGDFGDPVGGLVLVVGGEDVGAEGIEVEG